MSIFNFVGYAGKFTGNTENTYLKVYRLAKFTILRLVNVVKSNADAFNFKSGMLLG